MKRSDTEPLLQSDMGRSTAFKENITPSPHQQPPRRMSTDNRAVPSHQARAHKLSQSSPAHRARPATPMATSARPGALQRWHSQPLIRNDDGSRPSEDANSRQLPDMSSNHRLSDITNHFPSSAGNGQLSGTVARRHSRHGEIQERRLIGEVKPEIIPPPKTPLGNQALLNSSSRRRANSFQFRQAPESPPSPTSPQPRDPSPVRKSTHQITTAEPMAYWCGRFSTLNDRYRNEELLGAVGSPKNDSDKIHNQDANNRRMRRALEYLHGLCATSEARESFVLFQLRLAALHKNPDLGRPIGKGSGPDKLIVLSRLEEGDESERGSSTMDSSPSEARKKNFMHRLIGRAKGDRRSLVS
ncbi:hypothetical protein EJ03DRAFT_89846 [Teratosphaeria nubilosa]|uniref:Uncharacterized protein n=1 Tax=Teratosphaeria nubilosa TaxID=161662 RepID=A0A6G1LB12_9PEZI|nr:hypothetical protein EJ03DRAFT_89846 [Teratosphaeria nubilosa]